MKMNNVNNKTTGTNPKRLNGRSYPLSHSQNAKPLIIADLLFLFRLFRQYPEPFPDGICQSIQLPDVLAQSLPPVMKEKLERWQQNGLLSILDTGDSIFEEALKIKVNPGMQTTDYVAILAARQNKQTIITSTNIITREASRLKVAVTNGKLLLESIGNFKATEVVKQKRVSKNHITLAGAPALIAGNFNKCST